MDFAGMGKSWPKFKNTDECHSLNEYLKRYSADKKVLLNIVMIILKTLKFFRNFSFMIFFLLMCKSKVSGIRAQDLDSFENLMQSALELIWYMAPNAEKLRNRGAALPEFMLPILPFNDPTRHKHKTKQLYGETLNNLASKVTAVLENSFVSRPSFKFLIELLDKLTKIVVKYSVCLVSNLESVRAYQESEVIEREKNVFSVPYLKTDLSGSYSLQRELSVVSEIFEQLQDMDFYEFLNLEKDLPSIKSHRYMFMKKFKDIGLPVENSVLLSCSYSSSVRGNMHFLWKEDKSYENHENLCQQLINSINNSLPCFASRAHKNRAKDH